MVAASSQEVSFLNRHIGPSATEQAAMLKTLGLPSVDALIEATVPAEIRGKNTRMDLPTAATEQAALAELQAIARQNKVFKSYLGLGYYGCHTPPVIQRNILENPAWYTQYTPYQAEIAQGRLTSLLNFQQMIMDLTGMAVSNASVLDEGTAAAEAMSICDAAKNEDHSREFFIDKRCFPQTIAVILTRAEPRGIKCVVGDFATYEPKGQCFGALLQYPDADGEVHDYRFFIDKIHEQNGLVVLAADLLALTLITSPGELGADFAVGSAQRFGVPMGFGGPHAGYLACKEEHTRRLPGRIVGVSKDAEGRPALRLALQTREQHIRREKATSNICTAQALLANMAAMYAVYHGPEGLRAIARRVYRHAVVLAESARKLSYEVCNKQFFDTILLRPQSLRVEDVIKYAVERGINLRQTDEGRIAISLDETTTAEDVDHLVGCLSLGSQVTAEWTAKEESVPLARQSAVLTHPVFNTYHSETELMRYIHRLATKDLSLVQSMIPLGSCTMKLNAAAELMPISWPEFGQLHPFAPEDQTRGYRQLFCELEAMLCQVTGFDAFSLQPNSGAQGEFAGLLVIRRYLASKGEGHRTVCLIPSSAHGTNPASAAMAGLKVVVVGCDAAGNIDIADLRKKVEQHSKDLACLMVTYPSTHGVFEEGIVAMCELIHEHGGQVYMDGANMNAQVGLCTPGKFGPDVCHLNLHKTFCIPHGGGGPGVGPIGVRAHLRPYLPGHPLVENGAEQKLGPISAGPWGSAGILPISWMYIRMMGEAGLREATRIAILNANYIATRLREHYPILFKGAQGNVAHECIIDLRGIQKSTGITVEDVAKRLMDYGFHAPTIAWPVNGTMMIEPTESESKSELDRFCDALIAIRAEISEVESGQADRTNNLVKNAPHTMTMIAAENWNRPYTRERAVFPTAWTREAKFWPSVARIDNAHGDRNFMCSCLPIEAYS